MKIKSLSCGALVFAALSGGLQAQEKNSDVSAGGLEEIVVTAQRREQSLQDAAVPVESFDQEDLIRAGLESAADLGAISPALGISAGGGPLTSLFVRGVGALTVNPLTDAAVAQNVDGIYLGRSSGAAGLAFFDLERVELLKGPQGTLYGRNATGGVLNYIPKKPVLGEQSGYGIIEAGNYGKLGVQGAVNFSLSEQTAVRLSANVLNRDGYSDDGSNDADSSSFRGQVLIEPSDKLSIRFVGDISEIEAQGNGGDLIGTFSTRGDLTEFTPSGIAIDSGPTAPEANAIRTGILHTPSFAFFPAVDKENLFQDITFKGLMAEVNYELENGTVTFIPAYRESEQRYNFVGPAFAPAITSEDNSQTSFEARYTTDFDGPFNGIVGAFYIEEDIATSTNFNQAYTSPIQNYNNGGESWAVFGQGTYDISDTFRLNAGIRYTDDSKFANGTSDTFVTFCGGPPPSGNFLTPPLSFANGCAGGNIPVHALTSSSEELIADLAARGFIPPNATAQDGFYPILRPGNVVPLVGAIVNVGDGEISSELEFSEVTYRLGLEWDWGADNLIYAGYERGFRAGGVDLSIASPTYDSEFIDAFTIGSKNRFLDNSLQVNIEAFLWDYTDQQVTYFTTLNSASAFPIANGDSTITGLDVDVIWAATDRTILTGNVQFLDSSYDSLELISDPGAGRFGCQSSGVANGIETSDCSGQSLLYSPEFGADIGINHVVDVANYQLSMNADVSYRAEQNTNFTFLDATVADSYTTLNLNATLYSEGGSWSLTAFMRNVTDERYLQDTNINNRGITHGIYSAPKTYGLRFRADF